MMLLTKLPFFLPLLALSFSCQEKPGRSYLASSQSNLPSLITKHNASISKVNEEFRISYSGDIHSLMTFLRSHSDELRVDFSKSELRHNRTTRSKSGFALRFNQIYKGTEVVGAELVASFDSAGQLRSINSSLELGNDVDASKIVDEATALEALKHHVGQIAIQKLGSKGVLFPAENGQLVPGLRLDVKIAEVPFKVLVGPHHLGSGSIVHLIPQLHAAQLKLYNGMYSPMPGRGKRAVLTLEGDEETTEVRVARRLGKELRSEGISSAKANFNKTMDFYAQQLGRSSYDDEEATVHAVADAGKLKILDFMGLSSNAFWNPGERVFVFGAGSGPFGNFATAIDVVAHEYTHAVVSYTSDLEYSSQSGALNEHYADIMASMTESHLGEGDPMLVGESLSEIPLRNMLKPQEGMSKQPGHMSEIPKEYGPDCVSGMDNDSCGVHSLSGIPNRVVASVASEFGWTAVRELMYEVLVNRLHSKADFHNYRLNVLDECQWRSGNLETGLCIAFTREFSAVGLE